MVIIIFFFFFPKEEIDWEEKLIQLDMDFLSHLKS